MIAKKAASGITIFFFILLALIIFIGLVFLGTGLVSGLGSKLKAVSGIGEDDIDISGTQYQSEVCASSWECQEHLACVENKCIPSLSYKFLLKAKTNCHTNYTKFVEKKDTKGDCKTFASGTYYFEANTGQSKPIDKKGDTSASYDKFYVYAESGGVSLNLENNGFVLVQTMQPDVGKYHIYNMNMNTIYKIEFLAESKFCGWVKDSNCGDNSGYIAIRVDRLEEE